MRPRPAAALVFGTSAAVLVVELTALRLLAPYLGLTLETNTLVIGIALGAIAIGSSTGGRMADQIDPRRALAPLMAVSGVSVAVTPFVVRATAEAAPGILLLVAAVTILVPGALLTAVTPMVTKLRLTSLDETGTVVGSLSGVGTLGAILGTVLTGFVLISRVPVSAILVGLGVLLVVASVVVGVAGQRGGTAVLTTVLLGVGALLTWVAPGGCDAETTYHCASVEPDPERPSGRTLVLDGLRHSYVDLDDPTHLEFAYVQALAAVADAAFAPGEPLRAYHLGGGGLTLPHYLAEVRPGTQSVVSEIDGGVLRLDRERLGLRTGDDLEVRVEDGRLGLGRVPDASRDLVVGDAFGGVSVPWHLTTREAMAEVRRVLDDDGVYAANLIDHGDLGFTRAEVATLRTLFDDVVVLGEPADLRPGRVEGGNLVVVASDRPVEGLPEALAERNDWAVLEGAELDAWVGDAPVLTDDFAPVDQLLEPYAL